MSVYRYMHAACSSEGRSVVLCTYVRRGVVLFLWFEQSNQSMSWRLLVLLFHAGVEQNFVVEGCLAGVENIRLRLVSARGRAASRTRERRGGFLC